MTVGTATLRVRDAGRRFGRRDIFRRLELVLVPGERLFLGGPNGSGKSTLLRCLAGTLALNSGSVTIEGFDAGSRPARARTGVCLSPEQALYPRLSGHDNLIFAARLRLPPGEVAEAVDAVEQELDLAGFAGSPVREYSSGMRARVASARALLGQPSLLLLDEPTRSMDAASCDRLWAALERRGAACVISSHRDSDRERCDSRLDLHVLR